MKILVYLPSILGLCLGLFYSYLREKKIIIIPKWLDVLVFVLYLVFLWVFVTFFW